MSVIDELINKRQEIINQRNSLNIILGGMIKDIEAKIKSYNYQFPEYPEYPINRELDGR